LPGSPSKVIDDCGVITADCSMIAINC